MSLTSLTILIPEKFVWSCARPGPKKNTRPQFYGTSPHPICVPFVVIAFVDMDSAEIALDVALDVATLVAAATLVTVAATSLL